MNFTKLSMSQLIVIPCCFLCMLFLIGIMFEDSFFAFRGNANLRASQLRDLDEHRLAVSRSTVYDWKIKNTIPFTYTSSMEKQGNAFKYAPDQLAALTILVTTHNRMKDAIDSYNPHYLEQTLFALTKALLKESDVRKRRFADVNICVCAFVHDDFAYQDYLRGLELVNVDCLHIINKQDQPKSSPFYDKKSCMEAHFRQAGPVRLVNDYIAVVEDDMLAMDDLFDKFDDLFNNLAKLFPDRAKAPLVQLYTNEKALRYSLRNRWAFVCELFPLAGLIALMLYVGCKRNMSLNTFKRIFLFLVLFQATVILLISIGRPHIVNGYRKLTHGWNRIREAENYDHPSTGSAFLIHVHPAKLLCDHLGTLNRQSKRRTARTFALALQYLNVPIWAAFPGLFDHIGLYSSSLNATVDPFSINLLRLDN